MNKKIKKLYEAAVIKSGKEKGFNSNHYDVAEKLVDAVVRESITSILSNGKNTEDYSARIAAAKELEEYWGIK